MELFQSLVFYAASFFVAIFILVSVHEFGHFYVARLCGVKVLRFCIGLGKPILSYTDKKGTEFGLALIPLGGYVKMLGENADDISPSEQHLSFHHKSVGQRIAILAAGPIANFVLACLIFWASFFISGTIGFAPKIGSIAAGSMAEKAGLHIGHEIIAIDGVQTQTSMDVLEQLFLRLGETGIMEITVKDPESNINYESEVVLDQWMSHAADPNPMEGLGLRFFYPEIVLGEVSEGGAAQDAGLLANDVVLASDGVAAVFVSDWVQYVQSRANQEVSILVRRGEEELTVQVTPRPTELEDGRVVGLLGVAVTTAAWPKEMIRHQNFGFFESFGASVVKTWDKSIFLLGFLKKLILTKVSVKNLSGPVGIAKVAGDSARAGFPYFIDLLAMLSITLGVMNLLPIPILDGGHILFCVVEAIKGSPVSEKIQSFGFSIGLAMLVGVMVTAFYYDILRLL